MTTRCANSMNGARGPAAAGAHRRIVAILAAAALLMPSYGAGEARPRAPLSDSAATGPAPDTTRWALVLSGGGARGLAHVGVLRAIEELGLRPDLVVGTSMGSIVGALYASGRSSQEIARQIAAVDWEWLFFPRRDVLEWRGRDRPRSLVRLEEGRRGPQLPSAYLDDAEVNHLLARLFLGSSPADGTFDQLPIPFRAVATDLETARPVVLERGDLARAVRASSGVPIVFAPFPEAGRVLVDGGLSHNTPVTAAREAGTGRVLAVDVSVHLAPLETPVSGVQALKYLVRHVLTRSDGMAIGSGDLLLRPRLPGYTSVDFASFDSVEAQGHRAALRVLPDFARRASLPRRARPNRDEAAYPPLGSGIEWSGLRNIGPGRAADELGTLPAGSFDVESLARAFDRLHRRDLFHSAWPTLDVEGDSTRLSIRVAEHPSRELGFAAAWGNDEFERLALVGAARELLPFARYVSLTLVDRRFGREVQANVENRPLARGAGGLFLRGGYRETETRLWSGSRLSALPRTIRRDAVLGFQARLLGDVVIQAGAGGASIHEPARRREVALLALRVEAPGALRRRIDADWAPGPDGYASATARLDGRWRIRRYELRPSLLLGVTGGSAPLDALVGLGGPGSMQGLNRREWLGRRAVGAEVRILRGIGAAVSLFAAGQLGVVDDAVSAREISSRLHGAFGVGAGLVTPAGPIRVGWGVGPRGRTRIDVMLGDRF